MMHPWHLHGMPMRVVARDGYPLGSAAFTCDTLGVNPGERWDVIVDCDEPGAWAFHCHILPHVEGHGRDVRDGHRPRRPGTCERQHPAPTPSNTSPIATAALAAGSTAFACRVPGIG